MRGGDDQVDTGFPDILTDLLDRRADRDVCLDRAAFARNRLAQLFHLGSCVLLLVRDQSWYLVCRVSVSHEIRTDKNGMEKNNLGAEFLRETEGILQPETRSVGKIKRDENFAELKRSSSRALAC